ILLDRTADLNADAVNVIDGRARIDAPGAERVVDIRTLHAAVREVPVDGRSQRVAAALRNDVEIRAARPGIRAHAGRLELHLLNVAAVGDVAHAGRRANEILIAEAVVRGTGSCGHFAVVTGVGTL